jgi:hypothetical protein
MRTPYSIYSMEIVRGTLVQHKQSKEIGILLDIKVWNSRGYNLTQEISNKNFSSEHFPSILKNKISQSIDFFIHWTDGHESWIISSGVNVLEDATN